ncbi:hypothetical protein OE88DRAFT_1647754 [Heliocybe sulcata]|uniref:Uncharacterized protein n=1 Tax=Heliocybe sulcata TaxID=5364 RepID=A0A5C3MV11_9AGAM|nr:hypothetical protein OE88DRAFT_1647754 [Heliocybe sulcata]
MPTGTHHAAWRRRRAERCTLVATFIPVNEAVPRRETGSSGARQDIRMVASAALEYSARTALGFAYNSCQNSYVSPRVQVGLELERQGKYGIARDAVKRKTYRVWVVRGVPVPYGTKGDHVLVELATVALDDLLRTGSTRPGLSSSLSEGACCLDATRPSDDFETVQVINVCGRSGQRLSERATDGEVT